MLYEIRHVVVVVSLLALITVGATTTTLNCTSLALTIANNSAYNADSLELVFRWDGNTAGAHTDCFLKSERDSEHVLELVSIPDGPDNFDNANCCKNLCKGARVQDQVYISNILIEGGHSFKYVEGAYVVRHRKCSCAKGYCFRCQTKWCSRVQQYGDSDIYNTFSGCGNEQFSTLFHSSRFPQSENQTELTCSLDITAVYSACNVILEYSEVDVSVFQASD
jgi:hypothetical protein